MSGAKNPPGSGMQPAGAPDVIRHEQCYAWMPAVDAPEVHSVIVWDYERELPHAAVLDPDQNCWISLHDGARVEGVREWMHYAVPAEVLTGPNRVHTTLSSEEQDLVRAYRESDDRARGLTLDMALCHREHHPRDFSAMPVKIGAGAAKSQRDLERVTAAYQTMNPWAKKLLLGTAEDWAKLFPAQKPAPHLNLVPRPSRKQPRDGTGSAAG